MSWKEPKTDWVENPKNPRAEDFNRIEGNIEFVKNEIESKKGAIVNAMNEVGLESELTDTYAELANKITSSNQGAKIYTPGTSKITIPKGFHSGDGYVKPVENLTAGNIRYGARVGGVDGSFRGNRFTFIHFGGESSLPSNISLSRTIRIEPNTIKKTSVNVGFEPDRVVIYPRGDGKGNYGNSSRYGSYGMPTQPYLQLTTGWKASTDEDRIGVCWDRDLYLIEVDIVGNLIYFTFESREPRYDVSPDMSVFAYQLRS